MNPLEIGAWILCGCVAIPFLISLLNLASFARLRADDLVPDEQPFVSVLVPARNEEHNIGALLRSLTLQRYDQCEIIVLDDNSEDGTGAIIDEIAGNNDRVTKIVGTPLPDGWVGKNWACHQLSLTAKGEIFLFVDADTTFEPLATDAIVARFFRSKADVVSAVPLQIVRSWAERLVVPMPPFLYFAFLPNFLIGRSRNERFVAANGQVLGFRKEAYERIGGHQRVSGEIVEDIRLAAIAKKEECTIDLASAREFVSCRMYRSSEEVIGGFAKNFYPGLGFRPASLLLTCTLLLLLYFVPILSLAAAFVFQPDIALLLPLGIAVILGLDARAFSDRTFGLHPLLFLLHPASVCAVTFIGLRSMRLYRSGTGGEWKGRHYGSSS